MRTDQWPREFISDVTARYQRSPLSLFRQYQETFLARHGAALTGHVIELGGEKRYDAGRFFPRATRFTCTNVAREYDEYLDVTAMPFADAAQDAFVCTSVLAHVFEVERAIAEITRTLKPGGALLLTAPFAFSHCDEVDYWRFGRDFYTRSFCDWDVRAFVNLGGLVSTLADALQRPKDKHHGRYRVYKHLGAAIALALGRRDTPDGFPLGYGLYAIKR